MSSEMVDVLLMLLPLIIVLAIFSWLVSLWQKQFGLHYGDEDEDVEPAPPKVLTHKCPNCGVNDVESDESWEVCPRCRKDPSWWLQGVA